MYLSGRAFTLHVNYKLTLWQGMVWGQEAKEKCILILLLSIIVNWVILIKAKEIKQISCLEILLRVMHLKTYEIRSFNMTLCLQSIMWACKKPHIIAPCVAIVNLNNMQQSHSSKKLIWYLLLLHMHLVRIKVHMGFAGLSFLLVLLKNLKMEECPVHCS